MQNNESPPDRDPGRLDAEARAAIRHRLDESLLVEAAAGTGKTTALTERIVALIRTGRATVDQIVAVTFTRRAAGELKLRLREALDLGRLTADLPDGERVRLETALARLEEAHIGTIHAFCGEILRERPIEAGIDPRFEEITDGADNPLFAEAFSRWFEAKLAAPPPGLARILARKPTTFDLSPPSVRLRSAAWMLAEWRDFQTPWRRPAFDRVAMIDALTHEVLDVADDSAKAESTKDALYEGLRETRRFASWWRAASAVTANAPVTAHAAVTAVSTDAVTPAERDHADAGSLLDEREVRLFAVLSGLKKEKKKGTGRYGGPGTREQLLRKKEALVERLAAYQIVAEAELATLLRSELQEVVEGYDALKREAGKLDFMDLLLFTRGLLKGNPLVREHLQARYTYIFVDEFQDTDPLQAEILLLLAAADPSTEDWRETHPRAGKLFLVGDPKQSIYRFRRADVLFYHDVKSHLASRGVVVLELSRSFRATQPIQAALNAAFAPEFLYDEVSGQPGYMPMTGGPPSETETAAPPALIALPVPHLHGRYAGIFRGTVERAQPAAIASFVRWMLEDSQWRIRDLVEPSKYRAIAPSDVAILFRRYVSFGRDITRDYAQALENQKIAHVLVGSRSFHQREEVLALRAAATAIEWPEDELSVFATLKGPFFSISDDLLFRHRAGGHPFDPLKARALSRRFSEELNVSLGVKARENLEAHEDLGGHEDLAPVWRALTLLADLHDARNDRPVADVLSQLLSATRAHAGFALRQTGHLVLANIQHVIDRARAFEMQGGLSFRGFVDRLAAESESTSSADASHVEEQAEGVRIMTVHAAKGLEFPVVILADLTNPIAHEVPDRFIDPKRQLWAARILQCAPIDLLEHAAEERRRDEAEGIRLAYVAATRARDVLVVPGIGEGPRGLFWESDKRSWLAPLDRAIYPPTSAFSAASPSPKCPPFGRNTVLSVPESGHPSPQIRPGVHAIESGDVVWWDAALIADVPAPTAGLHDESFLAKNPPHADRAALSVTRYQAWQSDRTLALEQGGRLSKSVLSPSETDVDPPSPFKSSIEVIRLPGAAAEGRRFGTLVHAIARDAAFDEEASMVLALAEHHGRTLGASRAEVEAARDTIARLHRHEIIRRAHAASVCHRELPVLVTTEDDEVVDGAVDLVFEEGALSIVVDFKTGRFDAEREEKSRRQLAWYCYALERTTARPARGIILVL
ncbi:MAG: UvrD-helicase domain-containing protein [Deltaproteobacteria bacterium]|nr:UvrD-helicase domain-containing protein [Deltaproteobacteria bacterium]